jgi:hypothetical protein
MTSSSRRDDERRNFGPAFETPSRRNIDRERSPPSRVHKGTLGSDPDNDSNIFEDPMGDRSFLSDEDEDEIDKEIKQEELAKKRDYLESLRQERAERERKAKGKGKSEKSSHDRIREFNERRRNLSNSYRREPIHVRDRGSPLPDENDEGRPPSEHGRNDSPPPGDNGGGPPSSHRGDDDRDDDRDDDSDDDSDAYSADHRRQPPRNRALRLQPPEKFDPLKRTPIKAWLFKLNFWFEGTETEERHKVTQAALLLEGPAFSWWMALCKEG